MIVPLSKANFSGNLGCELIILRRCTESSDAYVIRLSSEFNLQVVIRKRKLKLYWEQYYHQVPTTGSLFDAA